MPNIAGISLLERGLVRLAVLSHLLAALIVLPAIVLLIGLDVTLRYVFSAPLFWAQEVCGLLLFVLVVLGLSYAWIQKVHVRMEMLYDMASPRFKSIGDILAILCGLLTFAMIGWQSWNDIPYMLAIGESSEEIGVLLWPFRFLLGTISALLCIQLILYLAAAIRALALGHSGNQQSDLPIK